MTNIVASFIIEVIGRPKEHLNESLKEFIDKISKEKGVKIVEYKIHEPNQIKESDIYSNFAEIEGEFEKIESLFQICFNYMPSHIEIIKPEEVILKNESLAEIMTAIMLRLHKYDEIAKKMIMDNKILENRLAEVLEAIKDKKQIKIVKSEKSQAPLEIIKEEKEKKDKKKKK